jgi:hypothetical protein
MLNIARQIYSGWNIGTTKNDLPEAEVIPYGDSSNEKKRLENLTKRYNVLKEHENIPLPGFTLHKTGRKNYGSTDQTWLIIDPRGYLVRITNDNLEMILHVTGITEGLIQEKCVWAREDSQTKMILVPVSSTSYIEATKNTALIEGKVNVKELQIGDKVLLQNKLTGIFMGVHSLYGPLIESNHSIRAQVYLRRQIIKVENRKYHYQTDAKILTVLEKTDKPMTREESVALMNDEIRTGNSYFTNNSHMSANGYYSIRGMITHISIHAVPKVSITLEEVDIEEAESLFQIAVKSCDSGVLVVEDDKKRKAVVEFPYSFSSSSMKPTIQAFPIDYITEPIKEFALDLVQPTKSGYTYGYSSQRAKDQYSLDKFVKFYKIVKHVKKESYI